ncbi:MAG: hypothetical protein AAFN10_06315, partial [Bacteroidota bacterium]
MKRNFTWIIGLVLIGAVLLFVLNKGDQVEVSADKEAPRLAPEGDLAVPVDWGPMPKGLLMRAERSDWDVYAFGERSIVVYDFRANMQFAEQAGKRLSFSMNLLDEEGDFIKSQEYDSDLLPSHILGDILPLSWHWQDTLQQGQRPAKLQIRDIQFEPGQEASGYFNNIVLKHQWQGAKPENLTFEFIARRFEYVELNERLLVELVLATRHEANLAIEYLNLRMNWYGEKDSVLYSIDK